MTQPDPNQAALLAAQARALLQEASPRPWSANERGEMIDAHGHLVAHTATRRGQRRFGPKTHPNAQYIADMPELHKKVALRGGPARRRTGSGSSHRRRVGLNCVA